MTDSSETLVDQRISTRIIGAVEVTLDAYLGAARLTVEALTALKPDAVIALDARLNQPVELRLGDKVVARGEIVAVDDCFGIRLTDIVQWPD